MRHVELKPGEWINNTYKVIREIGRGGLSIVYLVEHDLEDSYTTPDEYALKILSPDERFSNTEQHRTRFRFEQWLTRRFVFPHLATGWPGVAGEIQYIRYREVYSIDLKRFIRTTNPYPSIEDLILIYFDILLGVSFLHANGLIHRDLKPNNILLRNGRASVGDFGILRNLDKTSISETSTTDIMGSRDYISPEQRTNPRAVTVQSDVYSLGVILYEMFTRRLPSYNYVSIGEYRPELAFLDKIILKMLSEKPEERFNTIPEVAKIILSEWSKIYFPKGLQIFFTKPYETVIFSYRWLDEWPDFELFSKNRRYELYHIEDFMVFSSYWLNENYQRINNIKIPTISECEKELPDINWALDVSNNDICGLLKEKALHLIKRNHSIFNIVGESNSNYP